MNSKNGKIGTQFFAPEWFDLDREGKIMKNAPRTYADVAADYRTRRKPVPKLCPKCGQGAAEVIAFIGDDEINETHFCCSYCAAEWVKAVNPYKD